MIFGVKITDVTRGEAIADIERRIRARGPAVQIVLANAHTLNLAAESPDYRDVLRAAASVYGDGTGVRWASRVRGIRVRDNLVGTDLIPELFRATADRGFRYFLLGARPETLERASEHTRRTFPGWELAGVHHGHFADDAVPDVLGRVERAEPDLLLVAMGNPLQETFLHRHLDRIRAPVAIGVGGLFDHWAGNLERAPSWVRRLGCEWVQILMQQPHKWRRYVLGNPKFVYRMLRHRRTDNELSSHPR